MACIDTTACNSGVSAILDKLCPSLFSLSGDLNTIRIDQCIGGENPLQFAFCLVLSKLETWCQSKAHRLTIELPATNSYLTIIKKIYDGNTLDQGYDKFQNSWIGRQTHALLLIELVARNIYYTSKGEELSILYMLETGWIVNLRYPNVNRAPKSKEH